MGAAISRKMYWVLLDNYDYRDRVERAALRLSSDGCSCVPNWHVICCYDHDIAYRTHKDVYGNDLTKSEADLRFLWGMQHEGWFGRFSIRAWCRWKAVDIWGWKAWNQRAGVRAIFQPAGTLKVIRKIFR